VSLCGLSSVGCNWYNYSDNEPTVMVNLTLSLSKCLG